MDKKLYLFKLGQTFPETAKHQGDFENWITQTITGEPFSEENIEVFDILHGANLPNYEQCAGVILTGSHNMVTQRSQWSESTRNWLQNALPYQIPIFGICYGHQLIADAFGGKVDFHPKGIEIGTVEIHTTLDAEQDPIFSTLPKTFLGHVTHSQTVTHLPPQAITLAQNSHERHHTFRLGSHIWGVQFHPEFTCDVVQDYIRYQEKTILSSGLNPEQLKKNVKQTPHSSALLKNFVKFCAQKVNKSK